MADGSDTSRRSRSEAPLCSVSCVIATFAACLVVAVATICFSITYVTSISQLRSIGQDYARSLVTTTSLGASWYFEFPAAQIHAMSKSFMREDVYFPAPSDDPTDHTTMQRLISALLPIYLATNGAVIRVSCAFDDGSVLLIDEYVNSTSFGVGYVNSRLTVNRTSGLSPFFSMGFDATTMQQVPYIPGEDVVLLNATWAYTGVKVAYSAIRPFFADVDHGLWFPSEEINVRTPVIPACFRIQNASSMIGLTCFYMKIHALDDFFASIRGTANTQIFATDETTAITATTYPAPFTTYRTLTLQDVQKMNFDETPRNCWSTSTLHFEAGNVTVKRDATFQYSCRTFAKDYEYAPLREAAKQVGLFASDSRSTLQTLDVDGSAYYVATAAIDMSMVLLVMPFPMHLLLFMPESDVIGDVVKIRTILIAATAGIIVVASGVAALGIWVILRPIRNIALRLKSDAVLSEAEGGRGFADITAYVTIAEVEELRSSFSKMREAMDSFERYVPRTVVKELIGAGNLCHIAMEHRACTMMFTQISRFGDMCEAIPMDLLAPLLQQYFARVSGIAASRDGVVDKFIGDTIMIVWGAPKETADREKKAVLSGLLIVRAAKQGPLHDNFHSVGARLRVRVAVSTGTVLAGNMGTEQRLHYSVVGEAVAVLSRLAEFGRVVEADLLVDAAISQVCRLELCMHRVLPSPFVHPPYLVSGIRRDAPKSSAIVQLAAGGNDALFADAPTVEVARRLEAACKSFVTSRFDECLAELDAMAAAPEQTLNLSVVLRLKRAALAQKPV